MALKAIITLLREFLKGTMKVKEKKKSQQILSQEALVSISLSIGLATIHLASGANYQTYCQSNSSKQEKLRFSSQVILKQIFLPTHTFSAKKSIT